LLPPVGEDWPNTNLIVYNQAPPAGDLPQLEEMAHTPSQATITQLQPEANNTIVMEPPDDEVPMNLEQDTSQM
jgi:hypothetical protein